jgi:endonuclease YncB( thermonuclease family)
MLCRCRFAFILLAAFVTLLLPILSHAEIRMIEDKVLHVADGDTITVLDSNKQPHRICIAGINAPEKGPPFGNASRKMLGELVSGKEMRVEFQKYDRYGCIVFKVWVLPPDCPKCGKTLDVGLAQITSGIAWWFRRYAHEQSPEDQGRYEFAEQEARSKKGGLCQDQKPQQ